MVFGRPGSGKSTFCLALSQATGLPLYHLDKVYFLPGWVTAPRDDFLSQQRRYVAQSQWIIDGNATSSLDIRWQRAELVLYFKFPRWICFYRIFKRLWMRWDGLDDKAPGCYERVSWDLIRYLWTFDTRVRTSIKRLRELFPDVPFVEITSQHDINVIKSKFF
jgi:adenylate kinase family enzyme